MSTGLECYIQERPDGFYYEIERIGEFGPFATVKDLKRDMGTKPNPGAISMLTLLTIDKAEFDRRWSSV